MIFNTLTNCHRHVRIHEYHMLTLEICGLVDGWIKSKQLIELQLVTQYRTSRQKQIEQKTRRRQCQPLVNLEPLTGILTLAVGKQQLLKLIMNMSNSTKVTLKTEVFQVCRIFNRLAFGFWETFLPLKWESSNYYRSYISWLLISREFPMA